MQSTSPKPWYQDWTQWVCPGPGRVFTPAELARGGQQPWPRGVDTYVFANMAALLLINYREAPKGWAPLILVLGLGLAWLALRVARALWVQPSRRRLNLAAYGTAVVIVVLTVLLMRGMERKDVTLPFMMLLSIGVMSTTAWWFMTLYRVQQIEARLQELDAQEGQLRLSRRLATAQIHPHFVFNTLASLTQWVETQDPRAAPLLRDFNAYLRATLPMFEQESQPLTAELELVRRYLAIMQARMGERLKWHIEHDAALDGLSLPPGSLLTLVENAVTHGIEPALRGGEIRVQTRLMGSGIAEVVVSDSGEGLQAPVCEGLGLSNTRQRLQAQSGPQASLTLTALQPQGCEARITLPVKP